MGDGENQADTRSPHGPILVNCACLNNLDQFASGRQPFLYLAPISKSPCLSCETRAMVYARYETAHIKHLAFTQAVYHVNDGLEVSHL